MDNLAMVYIQISYKYVIVLQVAFVSFFSKYCVLAQVNVKMNNKVNKSKTNAVKQVITNIYLLKSSSALVSLAQQGVPQLQR